MGLLVYFHVPEVEGNLPVLSFRASVDVHCMSHSETFSTKFCYQSSTHVQELVTVRTIFYLGDEICKE